MKNMQKIVIVGLMFVSLLFVGVGCKSGGNDATGPTATYDIRGVWDYVIMNQAGGVWDQGTVTCTGSQITEGDVSQVNTYNVSYLGTYRVDGVKVTIEIAGSARYTGTFSDATHMSGTWQSLNDSAQGGTWTATKR
jgi:hypothetical protein